MIVLDTTILVYAVGTDHPLRAPCRALIQAIDDGRAAATTSIEVIQEFVHVRARRRGRADAVELARSYGTLLAPLVPIDAADLADGLDLFADAPLLGPFDAVLAATARRRRAHGIASADRAFGSVDGLRHLDPADPDFLDAVADAT